MTEIQTQLFALQDTDYAAFQRRLLPTVPPAQVIGVRTPALRQLAKTLAGTPQAAAFTEALPHAYFDENQLHAFLLCRERDPVRCLAGIEAFLPFVDNWATCDQLSPPCLKRDPALLLTKIREWVESDRPYTIRFGIGMLMRYFLDAQFDLQYPERLAALRSEEYYVNMMLAWYFATALAKQYEAILPFLTERRLDPWVHNKTIQKALESDRIPSDRKAELKAFKWEKTK